MSVVDKKPAAFKLEELREQQAEKEKQEEERRQSDGNEKS